MQSWDDNIYTLADIDNSKRFTAIQAKRNAYKRNLPADLNWGNLWVDVLDRFNGRCALTGDVLDETKGDSHCEHFIPLSWGHGGTLAENCYPLRADLNLSKNARNPFEWFQDVKERFNLSQERFDDLVLYFAIRNDMTTEEFHEYVDWCERNKRTPEEAAQDKRLSSDIWKEAKTKGEI